MLDVLRVFLIPWVGILLSDEIQRIVSAGVGVPVMSFTTFKLMHTSHRIPLGIVIFTIVMLKRFIVLILSAPNSRKKV